jgi:hypothetical protein
MTRLSLTVLNLSAALYLFANGIFAITRNRGGAFGEMIRTIFGRGDFSDILIIVLGVCGIAAGVFMLLALFRVVVPITDLILLVFIVLWIVFIIIVDIIGALNSKPEFLGYLIQLSTHLMVLGALAMSTRRFGYYN